MLDDGHVGDRQDEPLLRPLGELAGLFVCGRLPWTFEPSLTRAFCSSSCDRRRPVLLRSASWTRAVRLSTRPSCLRRPSCLGERKCRHIGGSYGGQDPALTWLRLSDITCSACQTPAGCHEPLPSLGTSEPERHRQVTCVRQPRRILGRRYMMMPLGRLLQLLFGVHPALAFGFVAMCSAIGVSASPVTAEVSY